MQGSVRSQFGRHVPRILRRQLILQLTEQYLNGEYSEDVLSLNECKPSIQRFYGALLFIDISGFTVLSQQLSPEDLKFYINEYFTKMLDIVDKHGGDVIKFAGDALFVIWETNQMIKMSEDLENASGCSDKSETPIDFHKASRMAVTVAVECGLEINETCTNHRVSLVPRNKQHDKSTSKSGDEACAFLNVHSGVTIGLMAGIDIGCNDRWEYFLMGEPLTSVAMAEAQASTGEIVICPEAHALLHPSMRPTFQRALAKLRVCNALKLKHSKNPTGTVSKTPSISSFETIQKVKKSSSFGPSALPQPCGCLKATNGYCKVKRMTVAPLNRSKRGKLKTKIEEGLAFDGSNAEIESVFDTFIGRRLSEMTSVEDLKNEFFRNMASSVVLNVAPPVTSSLSDVAKAALHVKTMVNKVKEEFVKWAHSCLVDDIARHVHDVVRSTYRFEDTSRIDVCRREITKQIAAINAPPTVQKAKAKFHATIQSNRRNAHPQLLERTASILDGTKKVLTKAFSQHKLARTGRSLSSSRGSMTLLDQKAEGFTAELRSVTVMFVKIDMPHMDLTVENLEFGEHVGHFGFLTKTLNESLADMLLLQRLQSCMEALSDSFSAHGGQLRQFIVDDKGTVCIGTFGLRGAVSDDNSAAALETAHMIVRKLQALGLNCSIGVTLGKNYCGLVGSENRHEYSVMGPSTNLSARLMCKAPLGTIMCDREIRDHDRTHQFVALADIIAKGYKDPVGTFKPVFEADEPSLTRIRLRLSKQFSHIDMPPDTARGGSKSHNSVGSLFDMPPDSIKGSPKIVRRGLGPRHSSLGADVPTVSEDDQDHSTKSASITAALTAAAATAEKVEVEDAQLHWIVQKLCEGPFSGSSGGVDGEVHGELIGRDQEVREALKFLFTPLIHEEGKYCTLKNKKPALFVGILGLQGIGKSSVMYAINHQVNTVVMAIRSLKLHVFKTRINSFQSTSPFHPWKCVIKDMLLRLYQFSQARKSTRVRRGSISLSVDMIQCVSNMMNLLPEDMRKFGPILGHLGIVPEQTEALRELGLSKEVLDEKALDLLFEMIKVYVSHTRNVVLLVCEDVHHFDIASQLLLKLIWSEGKGLLCLYSSDRATPKTTGHSFSHSRDTLLLPDADEESDKSFMESNKRSEEVPGFSSFIEGAERNLSLELDLFCQDRTNELIKTTLTNCGIAVADSAVLSKIYNESGGNPMYAYELAKSVAQMHKEQIDLTRVSVKFKNCHRLEEIICHRFDQLSTSAQSLLKIAAAICCHGSSFKYDMLVFVMMDGGSQDEAEDDDDQVVQDLMDIVNCESFLRATCECEDDDKDDLLDFGEKEVTAEGIQENLYTFSFNISLEKKTIYELLLGDQKQVVHERIAEYYLRRRKEDPSATHHYHEESLHWQKASNWVRAMACSYHAALHSTCERNANELIKSAYKMYQVMRNRRTQSRDLVLTANSEWSLSSMRVLFNFTITHTEKLYSNSEHAELTVHQVSQIFNCDSELLRISLNLEVLMARKRMQRTDKLEENQQKLEEALQMLLLTKECDVLNNSRVTELISLLTQQKAGVITSELTTSSTSGEPEESYFTVGPEFNSLYLKLMSVYLENYLMQTDGIVLTNLSRKVQFVMEKFHSCATHTSAFHRIHSWSIDLRLNCKDGNFRQACVLGQKIMDLYQYNKHSAEIIAFYGKDSVPCALAMISQYLFLSNEWRTPLNFHKSTVALLEKMTHVESMIGAVHFAVNNMVFLQQYDDARKLFKYYVKCGDDNNKEHTLTDTFYMEWLKRLVRFDAYVAGKRVSDWDQDNGVMDEIIKSDGGVHVIDHPHHHHHSGLAVQGRGIDAVLADVCALKIIALWNSPDVEGGTKMDELRVYCRAFCGYVRETLQLSSDRPHELMFGKTGVLLTVLHLLQSVTPTKLSFSSPSPSGSPRNGSGGLSPKSSGLSPKSGGGLTPKSASLLAQSFKSAFDFNKKLAGLVLHDERSEFLSDLRGAVSDPLLWSVLGDCHSQYSVFTLLTLSLLREVKCNIIINSGGGGRNSGATEETVRSRVAAASGNLSIFGGVDSLKVILCDSDSDCTETEGDVGSERRSGKSSSFSVPVTPVAGTAGISDKSGISSGGEDSLRSGSSSYISTQSVEYRSRLHQLMLNGTCELKLKLLERYKLFGLALAIPSSPHG